AQPAEAAEVAAEPVDLGLVVVESALLAPLAATGANGEDEAPAWAPLPIAKPEIEDPAPS
ncbi:MAG: hypothetical protein AAFN05_14505, partial [Pseudomonadota bacterium]